MSEALLSIEQELVEAGERARALVDNTEPRLFTVRPDMTRWSASECLSHLSISTEMFLPTLRQAISEGRKRGLTGGRKPSMDWMGAILRWFLEPPVRTKLKTAARFVPKSVRAKAEALAEFSRLQGELIELVRSCAGLDLRRIKIVSPFDKRVRYNMYSAFRIIAAHQRRHLWQGEQAVAELRRAKRAA